MPRVQVLNSFDEYKKAVRTLPRCNGGVLMSIDAQINGDKPAVIDFRAHLELATVDLLLISRADATWCGPFVFPSHA